MVNRPRSLLMSVAGTIVLSVPTAAQSTGEIFAPPVQLKAGEKLLGSKRLFPSPVFHDVNGDGLVDIVVGDLRGVLTFAARQPGDGPATFAAEKDVPGADGKGLKFNNW